MTLHLEDALLPVICWVIVFNMAVAVVHPSERLDGEVMVYGIVVGAYVVGAIAIIIGMS